MVNQLSAFCNIFAVYDHGFASIYLAEAHSDHNGQRGTKEGHSVVYIRYVLHVSRSLDGNVAAALWLWQSHTEDVHDKRNFG